LLLATTSTNFTTEGYKLAISPEKWVHYVWKVNRQWLPKLRRMHLKKWCGVCWLLSDAMDKF